MAKYYKVNVLSKTHMVKAGSSIAAKSFALNELKNKWSIDLCDVDDVLEHKDGGGEIVDLTSPVETQPVLDTTSN